MRSIISRSPYSGQVRQQFAYFSPEAIAKCLGRSEAAFKLHAGRSAKEKMEMIGAILPQIERRKEEIARLIAFETGKPISAAEGEVRQAAKICEYYSRRSEAIMPLKVKAKARKKTLVKYVASGSVLSILPSTSPLALALYRSLPQLLLGNCVIAKHSASTPAVAKLLQKVMAAAGFESGEYQHCFAERQNIPEILSSSQVTGVSFTGSTEAGSEVAAIAGRFLKPSVLHLGSSDSIIVLEGADMGSAIEIVVNNGVCGLGNGPKRIIVIDSVYQEFKARLIQRAGQLRYGDPLEKETQIGPMIRPEMATKAQAQLQALPPAFKVVYQRPAVERPFFPITIVEGGRQPFDQELLAPIYFLYRAKDTAEVTALANSSRFGSSHYVFGSKAEEIMADLDGGSIFVNQGDSVSCGVPKGGIRLSGYGREGGQEGIRSFANIKTVYIN